MVRQAHHEGHAGAQARAIVAPFAEQSGHQLWIGYLKSFDKDLAALGK
jgi:hypothetical protein